jgi:transcriptional regulator with XRE-family HTH domain
MSDKLKQDISIGDNLRSLRKRARLSQEEVAAKLELMGLSISREIISQMELGRYSIRVSVLLALKQIYNVSTFDDFFKDL